MTKFARLISMRLVLVLSALLAAVSPVAAQEVIERWYVMEMMGQRAGWMMERETRESDRIVTEASSVISVAQGKNALKVEISSSFIETLEGRAIAMSSIRKFGAMDVRQEFTFEGEEVVVKTTQSGRTTEARTARPEGEWLTPNGAKEFARKRLASGAETIVYKSIDAQSGLAPISTKYSNFSEAQLEHNGDMIDVKWFDVEVSAAPGVKSRQCVDFSGNLLRNETSMGGMKVVLRLSTREEARGALAAPEIMMKMFVTPDRAIDDPRRVEKAVYRISASEELPDFPRTGTQLFERIDDTSATVTVMRNATVVEGARSTPEDVAAGAMIDCKDPEIVAAMKRALAGKEDAQPSARAEALRRYAYRSIEKRLGVGFATASEVARTRSGDCTEHGVFLAGLLRANGIPARVVAGLIYADSFAGSREIFGYHMWTQAWIEEEAVGRWVDLDATLPDDSPYDATHITLAVMSLKDEDLATSMASMASTLGTLKIDIVSVEGTNLRDHR